MKKYTDSILSEFDTALGVNHPEPDPVPEIPETQLMWTLFGHLHENSPAQKIAVISQPFTIGRHPDNSVCVSNSTVSGHHAEVIIAGHQLLVRDCGSTNGTLLNGRKLQSVEALRDGDILHFGNVMFTVHLDKSTTSTETVTSDAASEAVAQVQFNTLMSRPGVVPYFQPIVRLDDRSFVGYEVLSRSSFVGLETPDKMFRIAAQRTSEAALSRVCREEGMRSGLRLSPDMMFYLNTHPAEMDDELLFESIVQMRKEYPDQAIMLEVHESAVTSVDFLRGLRKLLQELNIGLAYDDFGSGRARLAELIEVPPDVLKFDVKLVQGLPQSSEARRSTIAGLINIVRDLDVIPLAEGIETEEEASICNDLGFELAQGYLFGRGEPVETWLKQKQDQ